MTPIIPVVPVGAGTPIEVRVFEPTGATLIASVGDLLSASFLEELSGKGGGSFRIAESNQTLADHPTLIDDRNVVQVLIGGVPVGAWMIRQREQQIVGEDESRVYTVSGPGLLAWLDDAIVFPEYAGDFSASQRHFNWGRRTGGWVAAHSWRTPVRLWRRGGTDLVNPSNPFRGCPSGWPDEGGSAYWVWDRKTATPPRGSVYFRLSFTAGTETNYTVYVSAKNRFEVMLDGESLMTVRDRKAWRRTFNVDIVASAGAHVLSFRVDHLHHAAGLLVAVTENANDDPSDDEQELVFWSGGSGWKSLSYPTVTPGWTCGEILGVLLDEADGRGVHTPVFDFTDLLDSDGTSWPVTPYSFDVGATYGDVLEAFTKQDGITASVDPDSFGLRLHADRGSDQTGTVVLTGGAQVVALTEKVEAVLANTLLVAAKTQWVSDSDGGSVASYGRVESFLDLRQQDAARAEAVAGFLLEKNAIPIAAVTFDYAPVVGAVPWTDFGVGDLVGVMTGGGAHTARRVVGLSVELGDSGDPKYSIELDAVSRDQLDRLQRLIDGQSDGSMGGVGPGAAAGGGQGPADSPDGGLYRPVGQAGDGTDPFTAGTPDNPADPDSGGNVGYRTEFAVGRFSKGMLQAMFEAFWTVGDFQLALCSSSPAESPAGTWTISGHELSGSGYARISLVLDGTATASTDGMTTTDGYQPTITLTVDELLFPSNSGGSDWAAITHLALINDATDAVVGVAEFNSPIIVEPAHYLSILPGKLRMELDT